MILKTDKIPNAFVLVLGIELRTSCIPGRHLHHGAKSLALALNARMLTFNPWLTETAGIKSRFDQETSYMVEGPTFFPLCSNRPVHRSEAQSLPWNTTKPSPNPCHFGV